MGRRHRRREDGTREARPYFRTARGKRGEAEAEDFLAERGFLILDRRWRCRYGELDLAALDPEGRVCFVEVRLRKDTSTAPPRVSVNPRKQSRLRRAAALYLSRRTPEAPARFDVAEVYTRPDGRARVVYWEDAFS